jgi:phosphoglycolate phosphatase
MYKTIFFDLDGTLIDPKVGILTAVQYALAKYNIKEEFETLLPFIGPPLNKSFQKYYGFSEEKSMEAVGYYREYFLPKGMYESTLYKGIPELLTKLKTTNKTLFVVTSKPTYLAEKIVTYHKLDTFFDKIVGSKPDLSNAAKTMLVKEAISFLPNEEKDSFVMIGDREHDIIGAKANGIDSIGVLFGYGTLKEVTNAKPLYTAKTIKALEKCLV